MQKLITKVALFRCGVKKFTKEVNQHLDEGWSLTSLQIDKKGFRIVCWALLERAVLEAEAAE